MHYLGTVKVTYNELVELFGQPTSKGDNYKTEAQWDVELTPGHPICIYNYKTSRSYDSANPSIFEVKEWSVQGQQSGAIDWLREMIVVASEKLGAYSTIRFPHIKVQLTGEDGNAYNILALCRRAATKAGLSAAVLSEFFTEATEGDYNQLLVTCQRWFNCA